MTYITCVHCSSDSKFIVSGATDDAIKIWNLETGELVRTLTDHTDGVNSICYSPDDKYIASSSHDGTIKIWDATTGNLLHTLVDEMSRLIHFPDNYKFNIIRGLCYYSSYDENIVQQITKYLK
jgi:WD40 repeat protein